MKTLKYMIAAAIISTALLAGCNKENSFENSLTGTAAGERTINYGTANVTYQLQVLLPPAGALIKWNAGNITTNELVFNGDINNGEMMTQKQYAADDERILDLFGDPVLGMVNVPYNMFSSGSFTIDLDPFIHTEVTQTEINHPGQTNSLFLSGICNIINEKASDRINNMPPIQAIPVVVIIKQRITLNSVWVNDVTINNPRYIANLSLDLGQLTNGIDASMLGNAEITNGAILITNTVNSNLYNIIISNLQNNLLNVEYSEVSLSPVGQPNPVNYR